jgi:hypothetical protein
MWDAITALSFNLPEASLLERNLLLLNKSVNDEGTRHMAGPFILALIFAAPIAGLLGAAMLGLPTPFVY